MLCEKKENIVCQFSLVWCKKSFLRCSKEPNVIVPLCKSLKKKSYISIFSGLVQKSVFYVVPRDKKSLISRILLIPSNVKCQRTFYLMIYLFKDKTNILQHGEKAIACKKVTLSFLVSSLRGWVVTRPSLLYIFIYKKF